VTASASPAVVVAGAAVVVAGAAVVVAGAAVVVAGAAVVAADDSVVVVAGAAVVAADDSVVVAAGAAVVVSATASSVTIESGEPSGEPPEEQVVRMRSVAATAGQRMDRTIGRRSIGRRGGA
jgi:hypothetical protein